MSPALEERRLHDVALPHRHPARRDERVGLDQVVEHGLLQGVGVVLHDAGEHGHRARLAQRTEDRVRVGIADLSVLGRLRRGDQLVAGREHHDARSWMHERCGESRVREQPELGGAETLAAFDEHGALRDVLADRTHVTARRRGLEEPHELAVYFRVLDRHDRVCPRRDRRAGRDRHGLAASHGRLGAVADHRLSDDLQLGGALRRRLGHVGGAHREPVHRRRRERGKALGRDHVLGHDTAVRLRERKLQRGQGLRSRRAPERAHPRRGSSLQRNRDRAPGGDGRPYPQCSHGRRSARGYNSFLRCTKSASQSRNAGPTSSRSIANSTVAFR